MSVAILRYGAVMRTVKGNGEYAGDSAIVFPTKQATARSGAVGKTVT